MTVEELANKRYSGEFVFMLGQQGFRSYHI